MLDKFQNENSLRFKAIFAEALVDKGDALVELDIIEQGIDSYEEVYKQYKDEEDLNILDKLALALTQKCHTYLQNENFSLAKSKAERFLTRSCPNDSLIYNSCTL